MRHHLTTILALVFALATTASAQVNYTDSVDLAVGQEIIPEQLGMEKIEEAISTEFFADSVVYDTLLSQHPLPKIFALPVVYHHFKYANSNSTTISPKATNPNPVMRWIEEEQAAENFFAGMIQRYIFSHPDRVRYNMASLPEPPKVFHAQVNPTDHTIEIREIAIPTNTEPTIKPEEVKKRHWIHSFNASLQFSQAYISPNWYQGGNNNLNMLLNLNFNVKLNQAYHPNLLFETNAMYKLGVYSAPDDSLRNYSISEDLFQVNSTFGVKAARRWYYSLTLLFKTQILNSYTSNTNNLRSALLSPGELNVGLGMTYNYANSKKTVTFDASIAPLSYNMRTCISDRINHEQFSIKPYRDVAHNFGSSAELKFMWQLSYNIKYQSRLFAFTDYDRIYSDWENTLSFEINKFLTTQLYAHLRYDTKTPKCSDPSWHKLQIKEILSLGFAYKFASM